MADINKANIKPVGIDLDLEFRDNINDSLEALANKDVEVINRVNNIIAAGGESNAEIVDARHSDIKNITYPVLTDRLNAIEEDVGSEITASETNGYINVEGTDVKVYEHPTSHGNITSDGKIGTTANIPIITGVDGLLQGGSFGNTTGTFCEGDDPRLSDARTPTSHTHDDRYYTETEADAIFATKDEVIQSGNGDMLKSIYDTNGDGIVDNADTVDGIEGAEIVKNEGVYKVINLQGQLQTAVYRRSVIALCDLTNTDIQAVSYSQGTITFKRGNGTYATSQIQINIEKAYNSTKPNVSIAKLGNELLRNGIRACTFTYNGVKYGGIEVSLSASEWQYIVFSGNTNFNIFGLDYYNTQTSTAINTEINSSISFTDINQYDNMYVGSNELYHTGNISSTALNIRSASGIRGDGTGTSNTSYLGFKEYNGTTRQGYVGFDTTSSARFVIRNEMTDANIELTTTGTGKAVVNGNEIYHAGNISSSSLTLASGLKIKGTGTGISNTSTLAFYESDGTTLDAFIGIDSSSSNTFTIANMNTSADINLVTMAGKATVNGDTIVTSKSTVPPSSNSTGKVGQVAGDANYFYYCYATNTWARYAKSAW